MYEHVNDSNLENENETESETMKIKEFYWIFLKS